MAACGHRQLVVAVRRCTLLRGLLTCGDCAVTSLGGCATRCGTACCLGDVVVRPPLSSTPDSPCSGLPSGKVRRVGPRVRGGCTFAIRRLICRFLLYGPAFR